MRARRSRQRTVGAPGEDVRRRPAANADDLGAFDLLAAVGEVPEHEEPTTHNAELQRQRTARRAIELLEEWAVRYEARVIVAEAGDGDRCAVPELECGHRTPRGVSERAEDGVDLGGCPELVEGRVALTHGALEAIEVCRELRGRERRGRGSRRRSGATRRNRGEKNGEQSHTRR